MNAAAPNAAFAVNPQGHRYRLHTSTWLIALILAGVFVTWNFSGFIRTSGKGPMDLEWQNGWPGVFMQRAVRYPGAPAFDEDALLPASQIRFRPIVLVLDVTVGLVLVAVSAWIVERRRRSRGHFQYSLQSLLGVVFIVGAVLGYGLIQHRRQKLAVEELQLPPGSVGVAGYVTDQGTPAWLRRRLPGGGLRPFDRIAQVDLQGPEWHGDQLAPLAKLKHVKVVEIVSNNLDDEGLSHLRGLKELVWLRNSASDSPVTDEGLEHLADLTQMQWLDISGTRIAGRGLRYLERMIHLQELRLNSTRVDNAGLAALRSLTSLKTLELTNNAALSDHALVHLRALENLEILTLGGASVTDAGLAKLGSLKHLKLLDLRNTQVTETGVEQLQQALPNCRIVR